MQLTVTPDPQPTATLEQADDVKRLSVVAPADLADGGLTDALAPWGHLDRDHVWLRIDRLRAGVTAAPDGDGAAFDGMIDYARKAGWVDADDAHVRAHIERSGG